MPSEFQKTMQQELAQDAAEAKARSSAIGDDVRETAENLRGEFASSAEGVKEQAGDMAESVKKRTRAMADDQKDAGADQLHGFARAIDEAADQLENEFPQAASYVHEAAQRVRQRLDDDPRAQHRGAVARSEPLRAQKHDSVLRDIACRRLCTVALPQEQRCCPRRTRGGTALPGAGAAATRAVPRHTAASEQQGGERTAGATCVVPLEPVLTVGGHAVGIQEHRTVPELFTDLISQITSLFRTETQLARTEMGEKVSQAGTGVALIVGAAVLLIPALVVLLLAAVTALTDQGGLEPYWSSLIVGGAALIIGLIVALVGMSRLKARNLAPRRTIEQLQSDAAFARNQVR